MTADQLSTLLEKYDVPVPRYTSYPSVPHWQDVPSPEEWNEALSSALAPADSSLAIYAHLPFCETLCTFCGCNTVITKNHARSAPYVDVLLAELDLYLSRVSVLADRPVAQIHLGGGTPTFLAPGELEHLLAGLASRLPMRAGSFEGSVEVAPVVTTREHLEALRQSGLSRISLGVQDVDENVLRLVNRPQPMELVDRLCRMARDCGFESVNFDLIYGLPGQTPETMTRLANEVVRMRPDRLAVYSFARVPWIKPAQRKFKDEDVPAGAAKRRLYEVVRGRLLAAGYEEIGLDHFALPDDQLAVSARAGTLHRNFMGYTDRRTAALVGLGVSAISETPTCFHQNEKVITVYERRIAERDIPTLRGHRLTADDRRRADRILALMTTGRASLDPGDAADAREFLRELIADGLVEIGEDELRVTTDGKPFLRNIAAFFDARLRASERQGPIYSRAI
jgi:oxygen-independent coproporphyrinogen-3 oxidase